MMKRLISLGLCLAMLVGTLLAAGCAEVTNNSTSTDDLPMTVNLVGITDAATTDEAIEYVEEALNKIAKTKYKTKIELTLVTADEYIALVEERAAIAEDAALEVAAIGKYNALAQKEANNAQKLLSSTDKKTSKWTKKVTTVIASTLSTGEVYSAEETTVYEDGKIETVYPEATSPIDILMIDGKEMYDYLDEKGYLLSIASKLESEFTKFRQYIYPTFFEQLEVITDDIKAIPNNNLLAEYTYLVVDKALADKYDFNIDNVETYADLDEGENGFLSQIKANESVVPLATEPEALGIYTYYENDIAIGTYYDPIYGFSISEGTDFEVQNLFSIPEYADHVALMAEYNEKGYIEEGAENYAVNVIKGDASVKDIYGDDYYVKAIQYPFVEEDVIFDGMLAVSSYTSDETRALQIIEMLNTDPEAKNIFQYGIQADGENDEYANYRINTVQKDDGSTAYVLERLNNAYMMENRLTGNIYMGYPEEGEEFDNLDILKSTVWQNFKNTNLDSSLSPFMNFYVGETELDSMLNSIIRRAVLTDAFAAIDIDYDDYEQQKANGSPQATAMGNSFKAEYISFFIELLDKEGLPSDPVTFVTKGEGSEADQEFIRFALSAEGQTILRNAGYATMDYDSPAYTKKDSLTGKIVLSAYTGSVITYVDNAINGLTEAFTELYPEVEIVLPEKDANDAYNTPITNVGSSSTIGIAYRDILSTEASAGLVGTQVAKSYLTVFTNSAHATYSINWYENKMIEKVTEEKYADIVSASELSAMVKNKVASLAGIDLSRYSEKNRPASESIVLANAKGEANDYYTNIAYLRVMAEILLWDDLSEAELAKYDAMSDVDFETAVFNYVRANYETENNLTEEDYVKLVQDFMVSVLEYANPDDKSTTYLVSWEDFQTTKESAQLYLEAATTIKESYNDKLLGKYSKGLLNLMTLAEIIDAVYDIMYDEYLAAQGLSKDEFEISVQNIYLEEVGSNAEAFNSYAKMSDEYKEVVSKLRKEYKDILVAEFSLAQYKNGEAGISNADVVDTIYNHFLEEELGIYDQMCATVGVNVDEFLASEEDMQNYEMYLNTLKTKYVYTLRTQYTTSQIDAWTYEEIETNIYNILYETGFYTNEMASYIGLELSDYMLAKSDAVTYQNYIKTIINELSAELTAKGYNLADFAEEDGTVIEEICGEIVLGKYFSDKVSIEDVLADISAEYMQGIATSDDVVAYLGEAADAVSADAFFMAVVNELEATWIETKPVE